MVGAERLDLVIDVGAAVWRASWQASVLAALVLAVQLILGNRIAARWRHAMWLLVFVRLALPVLPSSPLSVFNLAPVQPVATAELSAIADQGFVPLSRTDIPSFAKPQAADPRGAPPLTLPASPSAPAPASPWDLRKGWMQILDGGGNGNNTGGK